MLLSLLDYYDSDSWRSQVGVGKPHEHNPSPEMNPRDQMAGTPSHGRNAFLLLPALLVVGILVTYARWQRPNHVLGSDTRAAASSTWTSSGSKFHGIEQGSQKESQAAGSEFIIHKNLLTEKEKNVMKNGQN